MRGIAALVTVMTPKRLVSICARKSPRLVSSIGAYIPVARIVNEHVEPPEGVDSCSFIDHIEGDGANLVTVAFHKIGELRRAARRGHQLVPFRKHGLAECAA